MRVARAFHEGRAPAAGVVARARPLDLDHIGAQVSKDLPRPGPGQNARKLENTKAGEGFGHSGAFISIVAAAI